MTRAEAIRRLESMATDLTGACVEAQSDKVSEYIARKIQAVDMAIAALKEQDVTDKNVGNKWISVKEDLPKNLGHYFISYKFDGSDMRFYGEAMFHPEGGNGLVDRPHFSNEGVDGMYVTHWMKIPKLPLPEPPKEDAE